MIETTAEQASSFMRWAAARLAKEVEDNERLVKETGTTDFIGKPEKYRSSGYTKDEKLLALKNIDTLRDSGLSCKEACATNHVHPSTYAKWRRYFNLPNYYAKNNSNSK
jgi:hypothetical protein|tara:strand:+ start:583 stop:909 length:327 start_codon:yes stop_codon:yes gene_type:complete